MKDCRELISFLMDYVDGELSPHHADVFQRHLDACPECVAYVDSYRRTTVLTKDAFGQPEEEACDEMPEDLVQAILTARRAS